MCGDLVMSYMDGVLANKIAPANAHGCILLSCMRVGMHSSLYWRAQRALEFF